MLYYLFRFLEQFGIPGSHVWGYISFRALLALILAAEVLVTLADFLEEDRTRRLPPLERLLHTVLTISYGGFVALMVPVLHDWASMNTALHFRPHGWISWLFTLYGLGVLAWSVRNVRAVRRLGQSAALQESSPSPMADTPPQGPTVLVTGATGFVGSALVRQLQADGRRVIALSRAIEDQSQAARAVAILVLVGFINIPVIKFSVDWWNSLHQPAAVFRMDGPTIHASLLWPLLISAIGFSLLFFALHMAAMRNEILLRRVIAMRRMAARSARGGA